MQCLLLRVLLSASGSVALMQTSSSVAAIAHMYTNSSTSPSPTTVAQDPVNTYILQGLGAEPSQTSTSANGSSAANNNTAFYSAPFTSEWPPRDNFFTATPNINSPVQAMSEAMQCWSDIATWRHQSASFWNATVAYHTWPIASSWSSVTVKWTRTTTLYPSSVSIYSLCDGTPRADVRPLTTTITGTSTVWGSLTATLTPTYIPQPCSLRRSDCRILYEDTNIVAVDDIELLRQCGSRGHAANGVQCLLGGGPVEIIYFPVARDDSEMCHSNNSTIMSAAPLLSGVSELTTLGRTFKSDSVYLSFKTLFASYDGFWDTVGPTFTDYIVPLHSTDISTQCGGWGAAYGAGTALNYGDLNWPVPASAYKCQQRCNPDSSSSAVIGKAGAIWEDYDIPPAPECSTIWSDVNPVIAVPTKIRDMVPEWSSCSFYNDYIANFWFDPPVALKPKEAVAMPTLPSSVIPQSTAAVPASSPDRPGPKNTQAASASTPQTATTRANTRPAEAPYSSSPSRPAESSASHDPLLPTFVNFPAETKTTSSVSEATFSFKPASDGTSLMDASFVPSSIGSGSTGESFFSHPTGTAEESFVYHPTNTELVLATEQIQPLSSLDPNIATAAGFSVLTQALSSFDDDDPAPNTAPNVLPASSRPRITVTLTSSKVIATQIDDNPDLGSPTAIIEEGSPVSEFEPSTIVGGPAAGSSLSGSTPSSREKPTVTRTEYVPAPSSFTLSATSIKENSEAVQVSTSIYLEGGPVLGSAPLDPTPSSREKPTVTRTEYVIAPGSFTLSATSIKENSEAVQVGTSIYSEIHSEGGPVTGSAPSDPTLSSREKPTVTRTEYVIAPGSFTLSAASIKGNSEAVQVGTAILSEGGPAATINGQILTKASSGVVLAPSESALPAGAALLAAGGYTVTAVILPGNHTVYDIAGTTLSLGGDAAVIQHATFTVGSGGLGVLRSHLNTRLPTVLAPTPPSTRPRWSSTALSAPMATGGSRKEASDWMQVVLLAGTLVCWLCT